MPETRASDGCSLDSNFERIAHDIIVNALNKHPVVHPPLPGSSYKADFRVNDVYIEVWGRDDDLYARNREAKLDHYRSMGLPLVQFDFTGRPTVPELHEKAVEILRKAKVKDAALLPIARRSTQLGLWARDLAVDLARLDGKPVEAIEAELGHVAVEVEAARNSLSEIRRRQAQETQVLAGIEEKAFSSLTRKEIWRTRPTMEVVEEARRRAESDPGHRHATQAIKDLELEARQVEAKALELDNRRLSLQRQLNGFIEEYLKLGGSSQA